MRQPKKKRVSWQALGLIVSVLFLVIFLVVNVVMIEMGTGYADRKREWFWLIALNSIQALIIVSCFYFFSRYSNLRRKLKAPEASKLMTQDNRAPVIYLRPFADDTKVRWAWLSATEEEQLAMLLNEIGPFITIGRPSEEFPESGAARMYVDAEEWQKRVQDLVAESQLIVLRAGETESLWWEIKLVFSKMKPERIVFLIPKDRELYERFRQKANQFLPHQLPEFNFKRPAVTNAGAILYFAPDWTPHIVKLWYPWYSFRYRLREKQLYEGTLAFRVAMRPVFEQLQIEWSLPPIQTGRVLGFGFLFLMFGTVLWRLVAYIVSLL